MIIIYLEVSWIKRLRLVKLTTIWSRIGGVSGTPWALVGERSVGSIALSPQYKRVITWKAVQWSGWISVETHWDQIDSIDAQVLITFKMLSKHFHCQLLLCKCYLQSRVDVRARGRVHPAASVVWLGSLEIWLAHWRSACCRSWICTVSGRSRKCWWTKRAAELSNGSRGRVREESGSVMVVWNYEKIIILKSYNLFVIVRRFWRGAYAVTSNDARRDPVLSPARRTTVRVWYFYLSGTTAIERNSDGPFGRFVWFIPMVQSLGRFIHIDGSY